jgi:crotonobetainyl-CoA:carnitine CoA-transferase CaiB-like acyl-CoA transferase
MVNVSAYGQFGPYRDRVGFDPIGQAICGVMSLTGFEGTPPTRSFATIVDRVTALHATIGALAALREREVSGQGQAIDVSLADAGFTLMEIQIAAYLGAGIEPKRAGNGEGLPQPSNTFLCKDGWVYIISPGNKIWPRVCKLLSRPEWTTDPGMKTSADRRQRNPEIIAALNDYCQSRTVAEVVRECTRLDLPAAPVNTLPQAAKDPHIAAREIMVEVPDSVAGKIHVSGKSIHLSRTPMVIGTTPTIGEHTGDVLKGLLQYSERKLAALRRAKAL